VRQPHKHADVIKAWADGAIVQYRSDSYPDWDISLNPRWSKELEYRVKPENRFAIIRLEGEISRLEEELIVATTKSQEAQKNYWDAHGEAQNIEDELWQLKQNLINSKF